MYYSYEDYLVSFYKSLKDQGFTPQNTAADLLLGRNSISDIFLGVPQPMTREQFLECYVKATEPLVRAGFMYSEPLARAGFNYLKGISRGGARALKPVGEIKKISANASSKAPLPC